MAGFGAKNAFPHSWGIFRSTREDLSQSAICRLSWLKQQAEETTDSNATRSPVEGTPASPAGYIANTLPPPPSADTPFLADAVGRSFTKGVAS